MSERIKQIEIDQDLGLPICGPEGIVGYQKGKAMSKEDSPREECHECQECKYYAAFVSGLPELPEVPEISDGYCVLFRQEVEKDFSCSCLNKK